MNSGSFFSIGLIQSILVIDSFDKDFGSRFMNVLNVKNEKKITTRIDTEQRRKCRRISSLFYFF